jgi:hypothetical protein
MRSTLRVLLVLALVAWVGVAGAAPPKEKDEATEVVTGTLQKLESSVEEFADGRVVTKYTAVIKVVTVERATSNRDVKEGDTINLRWNHLTRRNGGPGTGHTYSVHDDDLVRAWLAPHCGPGKNFYPIDNDGALKRISGRKP